MKQDRILMTHLQDELTDRLEEWQSLDVTGGTAYFRDQDVSITGLLKAANTSFNLIGDVGNDLDRLAEIVAAAFLR